MNSTYKWTSFILAICLLIVMMYIFMKPRVRTVIITEDNLRASGKWCFPILLAIFIVIGFFDLRVYKKILSEDGLVEWATFSFLTMSAVVAASNFHLTSRLADPKKWFFLIFMIVCLFGALEEISWSQRLFGIDSPKIFLKYSDQAEINVHNLLQGVTGLKTKHITGLLLTIFGVALPLAVKYRCIKNLIDKFHIVAPPSYLMIGFLLVGILAIDLPSRSEEELSELFGSMCFLLFLTHEYLTRSKVVGKVRGL